MMRMMKILKRKLSQRSPNLNKLSLNRLRRNPNPPRLLQLLLRESLPSLKTATMKMRTRMTMMRMMMLMMFSLMTMMMKIQKVRK